MPGDTFRVKGDGSRYRFMRKGWNKSKPRSWWIDAVQNREQPLGGTRSFRPKDVYAIKKGKR